MAGEGMTARGKILLGAVRRNMELIAEVEKTAPHDAEAIVAALVVHIRAWKPMALTSLDTGPFGKT